MFNGMVMESSEFWVVGFYKESYGYSRQMIYELEQLAMKHQGFIAVGIVDCEINRDLCDDNAIYKYPTIKIIKDNFETYVYEGAIKDIGKILKKSESVDKSLMNTDEPKPIEVTHQMSSSSSSNYFHIIKTLNLFLLFVVLNKTLN
ncbi:unnamed protein product [Diamesa tonsa]